MVISKRSACALLLLALGSALTFHKSVPAPVPVPSAVPSELERALLEETQYTTAEIWGLNNNKEEESISEK